MNSSGLRLLSLCSELGLAITNNFFQLRDMHKTSWMHPRSKHWHLIDYVIVRRRDLNEVQITRAMRGAECSTDHRLIRSTLRLTVRPPACRQKPRHKLNVHAAHNQNVREELRNAIAKSLSHISTTTTLNYWWVQKADQIHSCANINDAKNFYEALNGVYGPSRFFLHPVRSTDGVLIRNKELILARWAEYLQSPLNKVHTTDPGFLDDLPTLPIIPKLDVPSSFDEVEKVILSLKDNKTAGPDNIPSEVSNLGGCTLHRRLHNFILDCWSAKSPTAMVKCQYYSCICANG